MQVFSPPTTLGCEGFWSRENPPRVQRDPSAWKKHDFIAHITQRENALRKKPEHYHRARGLARSRLTGELLGNGTFTDRHPRDGRIICWPSDYVSHYIDKHNIAPTQRFAEYVQELGRPFPRRGQRADEAK